MVQREAESILTTIGEELTPYAKEGLGYLSDTVLPLVAENLSVILPQLIEGAQALWENRDVILAIAAGIGTAVAAYKTAKIVTTAYNAVMGIHKVITLANAGATLTAAQAAQLLNLKMFAIVGVIGAVVAGFVWLYQNWDQAKAYLDSLGGKFDEVWGRISNVVENAIAAIGEQHPVLAAFLTGMWQSVQDAWNSIKGIFSGVIDFIDNVFAGNWEAAISNLVSIFGNVFGLIVNLAKAPINGVISAINWVLEKVNAISFDLPDWDILGEWAGKTLGFNFATIPMLADGGIAMQATHAIIGEGNEPEAVLPLSKLADILEHWGGDRPKGHSGGHDEMIAFSPVFNFYGSVTREQAEEAGRISFAEFKRLYKQMKEEERRRVFA